MPRLLITILLFLSFAAGAQEPFVRHVWLNESNTPVKVNDIVQGPSGKLWMATDAGVYYFNGRAFTYIPDSIHKPATAIYVDKANAYVGYIDGSIGIVTIDDIIQRVPVSNIAPRSAINSIYYDAVNVLWVCTEQQGVIAVVNNIGVSCNTSNGLSDNFVYGIVPYNNSHIAAATDQGINEITLNNHNIRTRVLNTESGLPDNIIRVLKPMPDMGLTWVGTQSGGPAIYSALNRKAWVPKLDTAWAWGQINDILPMQNGKAWACTEEGYVIELQLKDSTSITTRSIAVPGRKIKKILCGRSGIIWCATNEGLTMITSEYMEYIPLATSYKMNEMRAMACDRQGFIWYALENRLYRMSLRKPGRPSLEMTLPVAVTTLYVDMEGRLWIGTLGRGILYREEDGSVTAVTDVPQLNNENVLSITGTDDRLWVSGLNGVEELSYPGQFTKKISLLQRHNKRTGVGSDYVYQLCADRRGRVWMATDGAGVCLYDGGVYRHWDSSSGMNSNVIYSITQDAEGDMWAATLGNGLFRYDGNRWYQVSRDQGLQDVNIATVAANGTGQVIVVNGKGVDVWYPKSLQFRNYNNRGSINIDSTSTVLNLSAVDNDGNVYIPFDKGFVVFKNIAAFYDIRPTVAVNSLSVFFKRIRCGTRYFSHDQNHISFNFIGINFANPDRLHYRYKLEGYNDGWIVTSDEGATFPQLPPGNYRFRVQASLNNTFSQQGESAYAFMVDKPFWSRVWFIVLMGLVAGSMAYGYIRFREENLRKVTSLQRERMMFEYEHLKSQVNPHFLFNSLNTLTNLIEEDSEAAIDYTTHLSDLYRYMLSYRDKDLILLKEEWTILENYIYIQQSRFGKALRLNVKVPELMMYTRKIVPLALQLLVENAIKHNVVSQSTPLTITIEAVDDNIIIRNPLQPKISKEKGAGLGLINIRKRYSLLTKKQITYGEKNKEYVVILPLL